MCSMSGGWVLIVEDDASLARVVRGVLAVEGVAAIEHATNLHEAKALASRPDLVGALVAVAIRALHPRADIVIWSGADEIDVVRRVHAARFDFLTKGTGTELLRERVRRWAESQKARMPRPPLDPEARAREICQRCNLTAQQARALVLALEQRSYVEIATALGITKKAVEALSVRVQQRTQRTLAEWTRVAREELHELADEGRASGVRPQLEEAELAGKKKRRT
jgi:FixJ family two-component response regulator